MTHPQPVEAEAVAWVIRADNGNTRLWTGDGRSALEKAAEWGQTAEPLYAADALTSRDERIRELEVMLNHAVEGAQPLWSGEFEDWKARALKAEALLEEAVKGLERALVNHQRPTNDFQRDTYRALSMGAASDHQQRAAASGIVLHNTLVFQVKEVLSTIRACKELEG